MTRSQSTRIAALLAGFIGVLCLPAVAENWPRFRGPNGTGVSEENGFPATWSPGDYAWKTRLPGLGHSSPCVWEDHVFVTSAEGNGLTRHLMDISASTGKVRWTWSMPSETHKIHKLSSYASATPTTDGKRVYVPFSKESEYALYAFEFDGKPIWKTVLGPFESQHGSGTSPIIFEDLVIIGNDQDGTSSIVAVDAASGDVRWNVKRNEKGTDQATCYGTPLLVTHNGKQELILTSKGDGFTSLDPRTGKLNWRANIIPERVVGSPVLANDLIIGYSGAGGEGKFMAAVQLGGAGELDETRVAWKRIRMIPYVPTPIAYDEHIYLWGDKGVVSCVQAKTGNNVWTQRLPGEYSGSPICVDGKLYCVAQSGDVVVIAASPKFQELGRTPIGESSHATPAISNGRMFIRGFDHLFCLEAERPVAK